jgi:hypothetical protein
MNRDELVQRAKASLAEAYEEAAELVMLYVERTGEPLQVLCKEIDPDNWNALRTRVQRAQAAHKATSDADSSRTRHKKVNRAAGHLRAADDATVKEIVDSLPPEAVERVAKAVEERAPQRDWTTRPARPPAAKPISSRLHDAVWQLWLIQNELEDAIPADEDRVRMLGTVRNGRAFHPPPANCRSCR